MYLICWNRGTLPYSIIPQLQVVKEITFWLCCFPRYYCYVHLSIRKSITLELIPLVRSFMPKKNYAQHCKQVSCALLRNCSNFSAPITSPRVEDDNENWFHLVTTEELLHTHVQYFCAKEMHFSYKAICLHSKFWLHLFI